MTSRTASAATAAGSSTTRAGPHAAAAATTTAAGAVAAAAGPSPQQQRRTTTSGYSDMSYWDKRYEGQNGAYDWYVQWEHFSERICSSLQVKPRQQPAGAGGADLALSEKEEEYHPPGGISGAGNDGSSKELQQLRKRSDISTLVVGCGNSDVSQRMFDDGFTNIISIDYSDVVIRKMNEKCKHLEEKGLRFEVMDARELKYDDASFDLIIDKGTLDAILCGKNTAINAARMLAQCSRVLKPGGFFFIITYGAPDLRLQYLEKSTYKWVVSYHLLEKTRYIYVMKKKR